MSFLSDLVSPVVGGFVKDVGDTVKQFVTTDKDRMELEHSHEYKRCKYYNENFTN